MLNISQEWIVYYLKWLLLWIRYFSFWFYTYYRLSLRIPIIESLICHVRYGIKKLKENFFIAFFLKLSLRIFLFIEKPEEYLFIYKIVDVINTVITFLLAVVIVIWIFYGKNYFFSSYFIIISIWNILVLMGFTVWFVKKFFDKPNSKTH